LGPVLQAGALANAIVAAIRDLNSEVNRGDRGAYLRVLAPRTCMVTRVSIEKHLGRPMRFPGEFGDSDVGLQGRDPAHGRRSRLAIQVCFSHGVTAGRSNSMVQQKTFWHLLPQRRMPSEYEIVNVQAPV